MADIYEAAKAAFDALPEHVQRLTVKHYEDMRRDDFREFYFELLHSFVESTPEIVTAWKEYCHQQWEDFLANSEEVWAEYLATAMQVNKPKD